MHGGLRGATPHFLLLYSPPSIPLVPPNHPPPPLSPELRDALLQLGQEQQTRVPHDHLEDVRPVKTRLHEVHAAHDLGGGKGAGAIGKRRWVSQASLPAAPSLDPPQLPCCSSLPPDMPPEKPSGTPPSGPSVPIHPPRYAPLGPASPQEQGGLPPGTPLHRYTPLYLLLNFGPASPQEQGGLLLYLQGRGGGTHDSGGRWKVGWSHRDVN